MDISSCMDLEMDHLFFCTAAIHLSNHMVHNTQSAEAELCIGITLFIQGDLKNPTLLSSVAQVVVCSQTFLLRLFTTRTGFLLRSSPASTIGDEPSYLRCHLLAKTGFKKKFLLNSVPTKIKKIPPFSPWLKDLCA